jgi:hypothetical protein
MNTMVIAYEDLFQNCEPGVNASRRGMEYQMAAGPPAKRPRNKKDLQRWLRVERVGSQK